MTLRTILRWTGSLIGIGGTAMCLTLLSRSMRSVQQVGGTCASGNQPFQVSHPCPTGIEATLPLSIFGGLIFLLLFYLCVGERGRPVALLSWSALFLSLGWNFLDYGFHITVSGTGISGGFLASGIVFVIMGLVPLTWWLPRIWEALRSSPDEPPDGPPSIPSFGTNVAFSTPANPTAGSGFSSGTGTSSWATAPTWGPTPAMQTPTVTTASLSSTSTSTASSGATSPNVATTLERLASLHRRRELSDTEYEDAKRKALGEQGSST